jgi:hypothetical protein
MARYTEPELDSGKYGNFLKIVSVAQPELCLFAKLSKT